MPMSSIIRSPICRNVHVVFCSSKFLLFFLFNVLFFVYQFQTSDETPANSIKQNTQQSTGGKEVKIKRTQIERQSLVPLHSKAM